VVYAVEEIGRNYATARPVTQFYLPTLYKKYSLVDFLMSTAQKKTYFCDCCERTWSKKYTYERHLKSTKRAKNLEKCREMPTNSIEMPENKKLIQTQYVCDYCHFLTICKKDAEKHRKSKQHVRNEIKEEDFLEITHKYICLSCDKSYDKYVSCWKHSKNCKGKPVEVNMTVYSPPSSADNENISFQIVEEEKSTDIEKLQESSKDTFGNNSDENILKTLLEKLLENKNTKMMENMMEKMVSVMEKMTETIANTPHAVVQNNNNYTNNNSNNNTTHNHCTINMFLNEKCKDAVNITEWANQLQVDYDHLYYTGENGFQKGLTNLLVENLKLCDVYNRPIHFTDVKRDRMYIRDADEWTKHDNNEKLIEVLEISARHACIRLTEWMREHEDVPDYDNLDSELGKQYLALMMNVIRPEVDRLKAYPKVMKELARTAQLRKEDQQ
jgi:hypothetical protein